MASSKVMASAMSSNSDLPRQSSICSLTIAELQGDQSRNFGSMSMDELLKNIYTEASISTEVFQAAGGADSAVGASAAAMSLSRQGSLSLPKNVGNKTVDEVWKEIVSGNEQRRGGAGVGLEEMTLEDFLTKAGAVREEEVRVSGVPPGPENYGVDSMFQVQSIEGPMGVGFGNGIDGRVVGVGRGKRRAVEEPVDKATQQKQRRMIKNRESAARSRERKQAYTVELESLVAQLEEDNARLLREEAEQTKERFKQLMENLIPVVEQRKPRRVLRRVQSVHW
ncbi:bZIP transcription factor 12-like isoform X2 [Malania oleifera]|uniref:bZIP transcription factor 12-like isoform X2 n=1 Tax=Malania oleifera TaxID=397392 RepID=UPI0025AE2B9D|nr:bZIP transcription factor 12-like isoform X2 [Malania oleifera]